MNSDRMGPESKEEKVTNVEPETLWGLDTEKKEKRENIFLAKVSQAKN